MKANRIDGRGRPHHFVPARHKSSSFSSGKRADRYAPSAGVRKATDRKRRKEERNDKKMKMRNEKKKQGKENQGRREIPSAMNGVVCQNTSLDTQRIRIRLDAGADKKKRAKEVTRTELEKKNKRSPTCETRQVARIQTETR